MKLIMSADIAHTKSNISTSVSTEQEEIHSLIADHVLNQANIPVSFRIQNPSSPFIGRVAEISEIKWAHVDKKIVILTGPHGVGKSELAKKYALDFKLDNISSTLWINSENYLSIRDAFRDLSITIGLSTANKEGTTIIKDVIKHFSNRKSLFIFDNAHGNNIIIDSLTRWIKESKFIHVIVTSRDENWDQTRYRVMNIKPFTLEETTEYIKTSISRDINLTIDDESCKKLGELLKFNPKALAGAVKEIVKKNLLNPGKPFTIIDFIESFKDKPTQTVITEVRGPTSDEVEDAITGKIKEEWERAGTRITDEAKRFGGRVEAEGRRFRDRVKKWFG